MLERCCRVPAGEEKVVAIASRIASGMMVMGYLSAIIHDKEGAANHKAGAVGGGYHSACLTAYGAPARPLLPRNDPYVCSPARSNLLRHVL